MKAGHRTALALVAATLLVALLGASTYSTLVQIAGGVEARKHIFTVLIRADELLSELKDAETGQRGYLLTGDEAFLEPWVATHAVAAKHMTQLLALTRSSDARAHEMTMRPLVDAKLLELSEVIEMRRRGDESGAIARVTSGEGKRLMDAIRLEMAGVVQAETARLAETEVALGSGLRRMIALMSMLFLSALTSALAFTYWMRRESQHRVTLQALEVENAAIVAASRQKSEFLATMSHELRTPLNAVIGFSQVLYDGLAGALSKQQREFVGTILGSGTHLLALINDILDLAKVEAGQMPLDIEPVQVSSLFATSLTVVEEKAAAKHVGLLIEIPADVGSIHADARKMKQILDKLLSNAVKFTPDGGQVVLHACHVSRAQVGQLPGAWTGRSLPLADNAFAEFLQISVTDTGLGIAPAGLERLFRPFSQVDSSLARKFEGTGLGLTLVRNFAELHGGAVAVSSAVGAGSRFAVWLPLRALEEVAPLAAA